MLINALLQCWEYCLVIFFILAITPVPLNCQLGPTPKVKTEITIDKPIKFMEWSKIHIKATTLENWPFDETDVKVKNYSIIKPEDGVLPKWIHCSHKGSVYETDIYVKPIHLGTEALDIWFGPSANFFDIILNDKGEMQYFGLEEELRSLINNQADSVQRLHLQDSLTPMPYNPSPTYENGKIVYYSKHGNYYKVEISPIPEIDVQSIVKISCLLHDRGKSDSLPNITIGRITSKNHLKISAISEWMKDKDNEGFYCKTFTITPQKSGKSVLSLEHQENFMFRGEQLSALHSYGIIWLEINNNGKTDIGKIRIEN